jgi:hypothetical protein
VCRGREVCFKCLKVWSVGKERGPIFDLGSENLSNQIVR